MKKLLAIFVLCAFVAQAKALDYTVTLSTYVIETYDPAATLPTLAGGARIDQIAFANSAAQSQTISLYDTADSTTTESLAATYILEASSKTSVFDYPYHNPIILRNLAIRKSSTGSDVYMTLIYR